MLAEGLALSLTLSHPASSRASRDYAGTRRERELANPLRSARHGTTKAETLSHPVLLQLRRDIHGCARTGNDIGVRAGCHKFTLL